MFQSDQPVTQEHSLGCAVACVAYVINRSYKEALKLFREPEKAWTVGYYCDDIVRALAKADLNYIWHQKTYQERRHSIYREK